MKNRILLGVLAITLVLSAGHVHAQCKDVVWPENPEMKAKAEESKVLYEDAMRAGNFKQSLAPLNWLLKNVPNFHSSLYIYGADIYDKLASQEKDPARKKVYVDSLMIVYDMRITNCGDEANVTNRKAISFLKYNANTQPAETLALIDKAFQVNGNDVMDATLVPYFQVLRLNKLKFNKITEDEVMQRYDKLIAIIDAKMKAAQAANKPVDKYQQMKSDIDAILITLVDANCDFVRKNLGPKFEANPTDINLARKIFAFMLKDKCTEDPLWLKAAETIHNDPSSEKDCGLAKNLGIIYITKENYEKAESLLKEAQTICTNGADKAEVLMYLGSIEAKKGDKVGARALFRQAASTDGSVAKQAYEKIGDLYLNSFNDCKKGVSHAEDRLVYLIAYDYYQKAGDARKMALAKEGFPSTEEIFEVNISKGATQNVGCWINESTTIRTRN